jgi:hypothetical protein
MKDGADDPSRRDYLISYGPCFFVMSTVLPILLLATQGRMTMERVWRPAMQQGRNDDVIGYVLEGVEYGDIEWCIDQFLIALPGLANKDEREKAAQVKKWVEEAQTDEELL